MEIKINLFIYIIYYKIIILTKYNILEFINNVYKYNKYFQRYLS